LNRQRASYCSPPSLHDALPIYNPGHHDPRAVLSARPAAEPPLLGPPDVVLPFSAWQLHDVRVTVEQALSGRGYERERVEDIVLRSEEHTSELQSRENLVCRLLL